MKVSFNFMDKEIMKNITPIMIRLKLEYGLVVWLPHKKETRNLERIQGFATKLVPEISNMT